MKQAKANICALCSLGCDLVVEVDDGYPVSLDYQIEAKITKGKLCAKGNFVLELLNQKLRVDEPGRGTLTMNWDEATAIIIQALVPLKSALVVEGDLSEEEASLLPSFAQHIINSNNYTINFPTGDNQVVSMLNHLPVKWAGIVDVKNSSCTVAVNDPFSVGPVIAGPVMAARNAVRVNTLNVISQDDNLASRFATTKLFGSVRENLLSLLEELAAITPNRLPEWVAKSFGKVKRIKPESGKNEVQQLAAQIINSPSAIFMLSTYDPIEAGLTACCAMVTGAKLFLINDYPNTKNISGIFNSMASMSAILDAIESKDIDSLLVLGADPVASYPGRDVVAILKKLKFLAVGSVFPNKTTALADLVLPTALWLEKEGTFNGKVRSAVAEPAGGAKPYGEILKMIATAAGVKLESSPISPVKTPATVNHKIINGLISEARARNPEPAITSSSISFSDGSLTDILSFPQACKMEAQ